MAEATGRKDLLTYTANSQAKLLEAKNVKVKSKKISNDQELIQSDPISIVRAFWELLTMCQLKY